MGLKLYLTTDTPYAERFPGSDKHVFGEPLQKCACFVWFREPSPQPNGYWWRSDKKVCCVGIGLYPEQDLAALGFPPPGELRVVEIGEYKESE